MNRALESRAMQIVSAFEQRLDNDKGELASSISSIHDTRRNPADFDNVRYIAHRINGGAGLFGCDDLAEPAKEIEKLVDVGADTDQVVNAVQELIDRIERLLAEGIRQPDWITSRLAK
ncbi:Hpt domain-containing protein [Labrenzia sp. OB1]|uniref:Hpt domain-containing protein n=1 Tax=Labrenzia sp. OB1 TaxID=1561204 RepID=UPI0007B1E73C|nr:Hpt domain-containing protein [Labrenzia sp. OB1]KZM49021.1 hypothetical protein OA90_17725 [Labrenzia sp. OB1]